MSVSWEALQKKQRERAERAEQEALMIAGLDWRTAYGIVSEHRSSRYVIWWRFELAEMRYMDWRP